MKLRGGMWRTLLQYWWQTITLKQKQCLHVHHLPSVVFTDERTKNLYEKEGNVVVIAIVTVYCGCVKQESGMTRILERRVSRTDKQEGEEWKTKLLDAGVGHMS